MNTVPPIDANAPAVAQGTTDTALAVDDIITGGLNNVQMFFARMQMTQAHLSKEQAKNMTEDLLKAQKEQREAMDILTMTQQREHDSLELPVPPAFENYCRAHNIPVQTTSAYCLWYDSNKSGYSREALMQVVIQNFHLTEEEGRLLRANCLPISVIRKRGMSEQFITENFRLTEKDGFVGKNQWAVNAKAVSGHVEQINAKVQSMTVKLQDFMGQYSSFLESARKSASKAAESMTKLSTKQG